MAHTTFCYQKLRMKVETQVAVSCMHTMIPFPPQPLRSRILSLPPELPFLPENGLSFIYTCIKGEG